MPDIIDCDEIEYKDECVTLITHMPYAKYYDEIDNEIDFIINHIDILNFPPSERYTIYRNIGKYINKLYNGKLRGQRFFNLWVDKFILGTSNNFYYGNYYYYNHYTTFKRPNDYQTLSNNDIYEMYIKPYQRVIKKAIQNPTQKRLRSQ